jgi:hypothetical protein
MTSTKDFLADLQLYADDVHRVLICCRCGYALSVTGSQATSHLRDKHHVQRELRDGLTRYLKHVHPYSFKNPADLPARADGSFVHPQLRVHDGFACRECEYRTINHNELSRHISKEHLNGRQASRPRLDPYYDDVYLQTWVQGTFRQYWIVQKDGSLVRPVAGRGVSEHIESAHQREHARAEEQKRIHSTNTTAPTLAGTRPWMERTRWEITYRGCRRDILRSLTEMPWGSPPADHVLGRSSNPADPELVSRQDDEAKIALLMVAVDHMLDRCEETMQHTGRTILCWLRSTKPQTCYPKPFTLVALKSSKKKYRQLLKRFFAFTFRAYRMPVDVRRGLTGIRFKKEQLRQMRAIWEHRAWNDVELVQGRWPGSRDGGENNGGGEEDEGEDEGEDEEEGIDEEDEYEASEGEDGGDDEDIEIGVEGEQEDDVDGDGSVGHGSENEYQEEDRFDHAGSAVDELLELVFQLSTTFSTEEFVDSQPSSSLLVYFSGILGFSPDARSFLPAKKYTPHLSALIYTQRLLFLEYALPLRPYPHLGIPRRSRFQQHQHFDVIRQRYMITGSPSPLEEFQSLRDFGRVIARTDPPSFLLRWSDDGETVSYGDDFSLTMESFRGLAEHFLTKAEELCDDLMFGLDPLIDLAKVKDDLTNTKYGFSFVQHPANKLTDAYLDLSTKACTTRRNGLFRENRWDWKAIFHYRKKAESLQEMIAGVKQTVRGQVARVSELSSLEYENSSSTERGLYVYNGSMIFITRHHKAKRSTNREFNVVRFLCVRGGQVVFKYLVYIRRFLEMLRREQSSYLGLAEPLSQRHFLFRSEDAPDKPWDSSRYTSILKKATTEVWKVPANTQLYRQLTIGITEKHVQEVHKPFNRFYDKTAVADMNVVFAWQSGHRPIQRATTYGLDGAFPTQLQPALLRVYEWASTRWHEFLHQPSKVMPSTETMVMQEGAMGMSPSSRRPHGIVDSRPAKRRSPSQLQEEFQSTRPAKRRTLPWCQSPQNVENTQLSQYEPKSTCARQVLRPAEPPPYPADIMARIEAWKDGVVGQPVSDDESDSSIDWDEPDMIPSAAPTDGSLPSWSRAPWPSWSRHNRRIEAKIDKARQFHGVFNLTELRADEQRAMRELKRCLDVWSRGCIICDFKGNPTRPTDRHATHDCRDRLYRTVQTWAPL